MRAPRTQDSCPFRTHPAMNTLPEGRIALSGRESGWSIPYQCLNDTFTISWWAGLLPFTCFYIITSLWFCVDRYEALTCTCHFLPEPESSLVFFIEQTSKWNALEWFISAYFATGQWWRWCSVVVFFSFLLMDLRNLRNMNVLRDLSFLHISPYLALDALEILHTFGILGWGWYQVSRAVITSGLMCYTNYATLTQNWV